MEKNKLLYEPLTYRIRGALFTVYNQLGFGHKEQVYQKALAKEFELLHILYKREQDLSVKYKGEKVGSYRPDFLVEDKVILELKAVTVLPKLFESQLLQYLKSTGFQVGLLVNFGTPRLYIKRFIWTENP